MLSGHFATYKILFVSVILAISYSLPHASVYGALNSTKPQQDDQMVKLAVFMESLCPDTRRFFLAQLLPTNREIGSIMQIKIVPFGHARTLGNGKMICQHGPRECEGNRRMACIESRAKNQSELVETLGCIFKRDQSVHDCVSNNMEGASFDEIEACTKADESYQMMVEAEKATGRLGYVPHLTVNGESSDDIQDQAENDLKRFICKQYKGQTPVDACKEVQAQ